MEVLQPFVLNVLIFLQDRFYSRYFHACLQLQLQRGSMSSVKLAKVDELLDQFLKNRERSKVISVICERRLQEAELVLFAFLWNFHSRNIKQITYITPSLFKNVISCICPSIIIKKKNSFSMCVENHIIFFPWICGDQMKIK